MRSVSRKDGATKGGRAIRVLICSGAFVLAGLSLAGYLRFATIYSALYGINSEAARAGTARLWGTVCLASLPVFEVTSVLAAAGVIRMPNAALSPLMGVFVRYGAAIFVSLGGTFLMLIAIVGLVRAWGY
jgi:hypothetical protein